MHLLNLSATNVHLLLPPILSLGINFNASIEQVEFREQVFGNAQVTGKVLKSNSTANHSPNYCCFSLQILVTLMW